MIDIAEERELFSRLLRGRSIAPRHGTAILDVDRAVAIAEDIGYPVLVCPELLLRRRRMEIVYDTPEACADYFARTAGEAATRPAGPLLVSTS